MKEYFLRQCKLRNDNRYTVSYIPEKYAILGDTLRLKDHNGIWTDGWVVELVGTGRVSYKDIPDISTAYRRHRSTTDI